MKTFKLFLVIAFVAISSLVSIFAQDTIPQLEKTNFRVNSYRWKTIKVKAIVLNQEKIITVKVNPLGDIWEYLYGVPKSLKGEQLFTQKAALREIQKVNKKLPGSSKEFHDIVRERYQYDFRKFMKKNNVKMTGWYDPDNKVFLIRYVDEKSYEEIFFEGMFNMWCNNGRDIFQFGIEWSRNLDFPNCGFSVRCLKN